MSSFIQSINVWGIDNSASKLLPKRSIPLQSPYFWTKKHNKAHSFTLGKHMKTQSTPKSKRKPIYINNKVQEQILKEIQPFKQRIRNISLNFKMDQQICFQFANKILSKLGIEVDDQRKQRQKQKCSSTSLPISYNKTQKLQHLLIQKQYQITLLQQKLNHYKQNLFTADHKRQTSQIFSNLKLIEETDIKIHLNPSQTLQQNLYQQAKILNLSQFVQLCHNILLKHKPSITNIHSLKHQQLQKTNTYLKQIHQKVFLISQNLLHQNTPSNIPLSKTIVGKTSKTISEQIEQITFLLKDLNKLHNINSIIFTCTQPCCKIKDIADRRVNKAKLVMDLRDNPKKINYYKTDSSEEYFHRYYKGANFDETKIFSLQKTKTQEMEHLETMYKNKKKKVRQLSNLNQKKSRSTFQI